SNLARSLHFFTLKFHVPRNKKRDPPVLYTKRICSLSATKNLPDHQECRMSQLSRKLRFAFIALIVLGLGYVCNASATTGEDDQHAAGMAHMSGHMYMTSLRPLQPGDQQKADAIVAAAKQAMAPYQDYCKALADGYEIFLPDIPQPQY